MTACRASSDVVALLHEWFPPHTAESWDAVGLVAGDPDQQVRKVMFAVDPSPEVAAEAVEFGADLLVVHHPLFLTPVHGVAATTPKGRTLHALTKAGCALLTAHTNADQAVGGVSEALATALGLTDQRPITAAAGDPIDRLTVYVPSDAAAVVRAALAEAGAGKIGDYDLASFSSVGEGRFRPLEGADPSVGTVGEVQTVEEVRIEVVLPRGRRADVVRAMRAAHPYEEPAYQVVEVADTGAGSAGTGRIGTVARQTLGQFADAVAEALPDTVHGVRVAGDPDRPVRRVAVCGGAGDFLLDAGAPHRRRRVRDQRPAPPPGGRVRRASRPGARRRRPLGGRVDLAAGARDAAARGAGLGGLDPRQRRRHRPVDNATMRSRRL